MTQPLFDKSLEYDEMLAKGLRLTGEDKHYYIEGRIRDLKGHVPANFSPEKILDFGCGVGDTAARLAHFFPSAAILGVDTAENALHYASGQFASKRISFLSIQNTPPVPSFDLCYTNGVFHHIAPEERPAALRWIYERLKPGGRLAIFENNPWNPGTRLVMSRIAFDRDAQTISPPQLLRLLTESGFKAECPARFLFYFPKWLAALRFLEPYFASVPFGAQYYWIGVKP